MRRVPLVLEDQLSHLQGIVQFGSSSRCQFRREPKSLGWKPRALQARLSPRWRMAAHVLYVLYIKEANQATLKEFTECDLALQSHSSASFLQQLQEVFSLLRHLEGW